MEKIFYEIADQMISEYPQVAMGVMMRSPAITFRSKVFAFYYNKAMIFKLDGATESYLEKYTGSSYLSPFKNKPPMKGWLVVPSEFNQAWKLLAMEAHQNISILTKS